MSTTAPGCAEASRLTKSQIRRGILVATALAILFLVGTGYVSIVTLLDRVESTDVMKAVSGDILSPRIAGQMAYFTMALLVLHLAMGALALLLALASAEIWPVVRHKFGRILIGWFCLLAAATLTFNALWYPRTFFGAHYYDATVRSIGPIHVGQLIYMPIVMAGISVLVLGAYLAFRRQAPAARRRWTGVLVLVAALGATAVMPEWGLVRAHSSNDKPNIILLGLDSLRLDQLSRFGGEAGNTSHIDQFLADADVVKDTSTPMPRTFGSWVAIMTGRSPPTTGARNNLTPRDAVVANPTIADVLRKAGYRTVYSTDEVRFANIDESYGFDEVITPPIGASDFILGTYNELPLSSVVLNTRVGQLLFPFSYGNRGAAQVFEPRTYLSRLDRELKFDRPTFLIVHLTAAHWPYFTAETPFGVGAKKDADDRPMYRIGLRTADSMFQQVVSTLERKGAFENAIVVVLSDHGEAMMLPNDAIVKHGAFVQGLGAPLKVLDVGHGQSVLSPSQYKILLGFKAFGPNRPFIQDGRDIEVTATAEDIAPTLLDLAGIPAGPLKASGLSLAPLLRSAHAGSSFEADRVRFTETDLAVLPNVDGDVDELGTARENSKFFGIDYRTARMHIRQGMIPLARAFKERSAFTRDHLLAAMPSGPHAHQYVYFDIQTGNGRLLLERPGPELEDGQRLWDALHAHFAGELMPPTRTTMADWPLIAEQWRTYLKDRKSGAASGVQVRATEAPSPANEG